MVTTQSKKSDFDFILEWTLGVQVIKARWNLKLYSYNKRSKLKIVHALLSSRPTKDVFLE